MLDVLDWSAPTGHVLTFNDSLADFLLGIEWARKSTAVLRDLAGHAPLAVHTGQFGTPVAVSDVLARLAFRPTALLRGQPSRSAMRRASWSYGTLQVFLRCAACNRVH